MKLELKKRILTSLFLMTLLCLSFFYTFILIISLILISTISWIEFSALLSRIFNARNFKIKLIKIFFQLISLFYLTFFSFLIFIGIMKDDFSTIILYLIFICIFSDIGGLIFGKFFKGKKLTKISPNKTISGSIGSFAISLFLVPIFYYLVPEQFTDFYHLLFLALTTSFICQSGDLFISYIKRKAKVKNTGDLLPGHGGILDRIDGMIFAIPTGILIFEFLQTIK